VGRAERQLPLKRSTYRAQDHAFGQRLLALRTIIGLTQARLAELLGVSRYAVSGWESGQTYPKTQHLKQFITLGVQQQAFAAGHEAEEIRALWRAARQKVLLDEQWLHDLLGQQETHPLVVVAQPPEPADTIAPPANPGPRIDWADALDVPTFYGRDAERALLSRWIVEDRCRVVSVLGMGGIGKSALTVTVMRAVVADFEVVIWRSLRDSPSCEALLDSCLQVLAPRALLNLPASLDARLHLLQAQLRERRVLLVLDNGELLLEEGAGTGRMREGFEGYARLLRQLGETAHQSCVLLTSREKPADLVPLEGTRTPVRSLRLAGLDATAGAQLLAENDVVGSAVDRQRLLDMYQGNPLALKLVARTITELFGSETAPFLAQGEVVFGGVRELLDEQFVRLSALERSVFFWLAILHEPVSLEELLTYLSVPQTSVQLLEALEGLNRRSLIERGQRAGSFTLQSVVLEYATGRLIAEASNEIEQGQLDHLIEYALCQAQAKDYVRQVQEQLLVAPLLAGLQHRYPEQTRAEARLLGLLDHLHGWPQPLQGYGPANLLALLRLLRGNLRGLNLGGLTLRGVFLQGVEMQDTSLFGTVLKDIVFTDAFDGILALAISSSGTYWAAATWRGEVRVWGEAGKTLHHVWLAHTSVVSALAFSPDERALVSTSYDNMIKLWSVEHGTLLWEGVQTGSINGAAFAPDGHLLASGGNDGQIHVWDVQRGTEVQTLSAQGLIVNSLVWSPDGKLLASGFADGSIWMWNVLDAAPFTHARTLAGHTKWVPGLAFAPDSNQLASASFDGMVKLWDLNSGACLQTFSQHTAPVIRVAWSPDGHTLASCGVDQTIRLWSLEDRRSVVVMHGHTAVIYTVVFTPDSRTLLSGSYDGTIRVWNVATGQSLRTMKGYVASLFDIDWSSDGTRLACGGADTLVTIWDVASTTAPNILRGHRWLVYGVAWSADGQLLASAGYDNRIGLWNPDTGICSQMLQDPDAADTIFLGVAWHPDGHLLACGSDLRGVQVWDVSTGTRRWVGHTQPIRTRRVAWSPAGTQLAAGGDDGCVYLLDALDGTLQQRLVGHIGVVLSVAWSPDGMRLASAGGGSASAELFVWEAHSGERVQAMAGHSGVAATVAWGPRGELVVSGGSDGMLRWWDVASGQCVRVRDAHQGKVQALKVSPDGKRLASCGDDGAIVLWDLYTGERLQTLRRDRPYERMDITGLRGITSAQRASLVALGAVERPHEPVPSPTHVPIPADAQQMSHGDQRLVGNLPVPPTPLIGRSTEVAEISKLLGDASCRLLTLLGPGGIGKTRLALHVASAHTAAFADGVTFVALDTVDTLQQMIAAIGDALGLALMGATDPVTHLLGELRERHMLLILDNFEHFLAGADLVSELLAYAPHISVLATSRERLNLQAEWLFNVGGLAYPSEDLDDSASSALANYSAVQLFVQRANQVQPMPLDDAALRTIAHICRYVAGMPLAIELVAAATRTMSLADIERQIRTNLDAFVSTLLDLPPRHRSLRALFDHAWKLLDGHEHVLFSRLAVFPASWTAAAAEQVAGATLPTLTALIDKSLVRRISVVTQAGEPSLPEPRYIMLEPFREYALEQLVARGEAQAIAQAHTRFYRDLAEAVATQRSTATFDAALVQLQREYDNIRAALQSVSDGGDPSVALQLVGALERLATLVSQPEHVTLLAQLLAVASAPH